MNAGALAGLLAAGGVLLALSAWRNRRPSFAERVAPYVSRRERLVVASGGRSPLPPTLTAILTRDLSRLLDKTGSTALSVRQRLAVLGSDQTVDAFRLEQVVWGCLGLAAALVAAGTLALARGVPAGPMLLAVALCGLVGVLARDWVLTRQVARRRAQIAAELPTIAELLALAVGAGESPTAALDRVTRSTDGELSRELGRLLGDLRAGASLATALAALSSRIDVPALTRFTDGLAVAIERGSPVADVLRAQAGDARDAARQELMESGGKREIAMLVPVVAFLLPLTVVFALFPGIALLESGLP